MACVSQATVCVCVCVCVFVCVSLELFIYRALKLWPEVK